MEQSHSGGGNERRGGHCSDRTMNMWWGYSPWALHKPLRDSYPQPCKLLFFLSSFGAVRGYKSHWTCPAVIWSNLARTAWLQWKEELKKTWRTKGSEEQGKEGDLCRTVGFSSQEAQYLWIFWHPLKSCPLPKCSNDHSRELILAENLFLFPSH